MVQHHFGYQDSIVFVPVLMGHFFLSKFKVYRSTDRRLWYFSEFEDPIWVVPKDLTHTIEISHVLFIDPPGSMVNLDLHFQVPPKKNVAS